MSTVHHAMAEEQAHLVETLSLVSVETERQEREVAEMLITLNSLRGQGMLTSDLIVMENLYANRTQSLHHLGLARDKAYFTRVDFTPVSDGKQRTYYIGKWGVSNSETLAPKVIDWRAPVANLYYAGQLGTVRYTAPDGEIEGNLSLKRQIGIQNGQIETLFDTDVAAQDAYLMGVLGEVRGQRLRDIVTTIQAEQNVIIRHPLREGLIVQGVAGSGKTTIALHRIAYLLYANRDNLQPKQMMILAPNPLFLDYISAVLPDLGVEQVLQTTFSQHVQGLLGKAAYKVQETDRLEAMLEMPDQQRSAQEAALRFMGSLRFRELLLAFIKQLEVSIVPEGDVTFGPAVLYTNQQMHDIYEIELAPFPFARRIVEFGKYLKKKKNSAQQQAATWYETECEKRADQIMAQMRDGEERRARMFRLYDSRDERLLEIKAKAKTFEKDELARWPKLVLMEQYAQFMSDAWNPPLTDDERPLFEAICAHKAELFEKKRIEPEDLAPLATLALRLLGLPRVEIRHTVIDEAQDFSPFQFMLLRELCGNDSFTIVGDLMQGVRAFEGLKAWQEILGPVFEGKGASLHPLRTSYRSTVEIMQYASIVAKRRPVPGQMLARPVLRHGEEPSAHAFQTKKERNAFVQTQIEAWQAEGFTTMAIIGRDATECAALHKALPKALGARLIKAGDTQYTGGVLIMPASLVKGLEFDCVLMADVSESAFPDEPLFARLLYVCLTRPLHALCCCHIGEITPLLAP